MAWPNPCCIRLEPRLSPVWGARVLIARDRGRYGEQVQHAMPPACMPKASVCSTNPSPTTAIYRVAFRVAEGVRRCRQPAQAPSRERRRLAGNPRPPTFTAISSANQALKATKTAINAGAAISTTMHPPARVALFFVELWTLFIIIGAFAFRLDCGACRVLLLPPTCAYPT